jgi:hypothetical protein
VNNATDRNLVASTCGGSCHLVERRHDRKITRQDLNQLRVGIESKPNVAEGPWDKDFGSFKLCGEGRYPKTFLLSGQAATGQNL